MSETHIGWTGSRTLVGAFALGVALAVTATAPRAQTGGQATGRAIRINAATAVAVADWDRQIDGLRRDGALRLSASRPDTLIEGRTHERFDQYFNGVRVFGAQTVRQLTAEGQAVSVFGTVHAEIALDTTPTLDADRAIARAVELTGGIVLARAPELLVLPQEGGTYVLAWLLHVRTNATVLSLFIDAKSGAELQRLSDIHGDAKVGIGTGVLGDQKKLSVNALSGAFYADDQLRPPSIITVDARGDLNRAERILDGLTSILRSDVASDTDNVWTDGANVDAQAYLGYTYDYYFKRFGRRGLDNRDSPILALTHPVVRSRALEYLRNDPDRFSTFYANAFWCGACGPNGAGMMMFGEGLPVGVFTIELNYFAGAIDIVGHELTHAVTEYTSNLIYLNEPGALNEAFSDMMGSSVEAFFQPAGNGPLKSDWLLGEDIAPRLPGFMRSFSNPEEFGDPDHYSKRYVGLDDSGGVHTNSGIANHAFYLAIEGGTNRTSGQTVTGVGAANREQIEKVFYRAFTQLLPPDATFAVARQATLQAATDLYGGSSTAYRAVSQAWSAVGVN
jgi:thermolysin